MCIRNMHQGDSNTLDFTNRERYMECGASRIDIAYRWGEGRMTMAKHVPIAFSNHHALYWTMTMPDIDKIKNPKSRPRFRLTNEVLEESQFRDALREGMTIWKRIRGFGDKDDGPATLSWWERLVKPEIKRIGINRARKGRSWTL